MFFLKKNLILVLLLGFSSGLPLGLTASTLTAFLTDAGIDVGTIGLFGFVAMPYTFKFLWSPLVDNIKLPVFCSILGRRRGWLIFTQVILMLSIILLGMSRPAEAAYFTAIMACMVSFVSATQDIVVDAFRIEILKPDEQGMGISMFIFGYRIGMLVSTAGVLYLASFYNWELAYFLISFLVLIGTVATLLCKEPVFSEAKKNNYNRDISSWIIHSFVEPFMEFAKRVNALPVLLFILLYKLSDAYIGSMTTPFLLKTGFSKIEIANIVKTYGLVATLAGTFAGGWLAKQIGLFRLLIIGCIMQIISNLAFVLLSVYGHDNYVLMLVITAENFCSGLSNAAIVAYISLLCSKEFTASQYAVLSSFVTFGRTTLSSSAGYVVEYLGWSNFFIFSAILSLPVLFFMKAVMKTIPKKAN